MSRSGYSDEYEETVNLWRGTVARAIKGKRGQAFLKEMLGALDALPEKKLVANELVEKDGCVCALGAVGRARGMDMKDIDPEDHEGVAHKFGMAHALACEVMYVNDEMGPYTRTETSEERFVRVRAWVAEKINSPVGS